MLLILQIQVMQISTTVVSSNLDVMQMRPMTYATLFVMQTMKQHGNATTIAVLNSGRAHTTLLARLISIPVHLLVVLTAQPKKPIAYNHTVMKRNTFQMTKLVNARLDVLPQGHPGTETLMLHLLNADAQQESTIMLRIHLPVQLRLAIMVKYGM
jgi:hypothetical protein